MIRLQTDEELIRALPVMQYLRPHITDAEMFISMVREGEEKEGYILFGLEEDGTLVAVCGVQPFVTLYYDRLLWICDLVTSENVRSRGYGKTLLTQVEHWARENGYLEIALSSRLFRTDAHRFYTDKMQYECTSYIFQKKLPQE